MALNLLKLAVGCESIADLEGWIAETRAEMRRLGRPYEQLHTTRMVPKRLADLFPKDGEAGSLYWVIRGQVQARQRLRAIRPFIDGEGIGRCHIILEPVVVPVRPRPCRPFQGWRYLTAQDAPPDLSESSAPGVALPEAMRRELLALGLL